MDFNFSLIHRNPAVLGLHGKVLVAGGDTWGGFCVKLPEASLVSGGANFTGSKTDPSPAKAEPISISGSTSGITYLKKK